MNEKIQYDYISPIFIYNQKIGIIYLYQKDFDYKKCFYYYQYLYNSQLNSAINLFANEENLYSRLKNPVPSDEEFYLIRKDIILDIKRENNYELYKKYFIGKNNNNFIGEIEKYLLIKNIPQEELINLSKININIHQNYNKVVNQANYELDKTQIQIPNNSSMIFTIGKDFELIEKNCADYLFKDINQKPYTKIICSFLGNNMVIFHYQNSAFGDKYNLCIISKYDIDKKDFINEYLIIYNTYKSYQKHINQIKNNIYNFLINLKFNNDNIAKINHPELNNVGTILKLNESFISNPRRSITSQEQTNLNNIIQPNHNSFVSLSKIKTTKNIFDLKPLIGLENIGATPYMNATLQCLCNIEKFADYFFIPHPLLEQKTGNDIQNKKLCTSFKELIDNLYPELNQNKTGFKKLKNKNVKIFNKDNKTFIKGFYAPREFKIKISQMNPLFEGKQANDAKDLVNFLIMTLHDELNKAPPNQIEEFNGNIFEEQKNKALMFQNFSKNFVKTQQSIISDLFYALNYNKTQCSNCQTYSYNYQIYFFLIFPLEEVRKFKITKNSGIFNNNKQNEVDIFDCFEFERKVFFMSGDNAMYCNYCKQTCASSMCTILATGPEILIIILNRGKGNEFNVKLNFTPFLDLSNYIELKEIGCQYELIGVITHIGESGISGHFIAYCKEYWYNTWLKFNDAMVSLVDDFQNEVIQPAIPHLLFYKKIKK